MSQDQNPSPIKMIVSDELYQASANRPALEARSNRITRDPERRQAQPQYQYSNRKIYEKLELDIAAVAPSRSIFLIANKSHFAQGENAQFQCSSHGRRFAKGVILRHRRGRTGGARQSPPFASGTHDGAPGEADGC